MEIVYHYYDHLWTSYLHHIENADKRVENWTLMSAYWPTLLLTLVYLVIVRSGPKLMRDRKPVQCRTALFLYNLFLVGLNWHIFSEIVISMYNSSYNLFCQPVNYSNDPNELRMAEALWWFYISKLFEFVDTFFFIVRKKNNQITFLHVYHHATMFPIWWIGVKWVAGGQSSMGAVINSFIHILMYSYYALSSLGAGVQKYLWWKKYLTTLQLIQFVIGFSHASHSIYFGCPFPVWMQWALIFYANSILILFLNFYIRAYLRPQPSTRKLQKSFQNGGCERSNVDNGELFHRSADVDDLGRGDLGNGLINKSLLTGLGENGDRSKLGGFENGVENGKEERVSKLEGSLVKHVTVRNKKHN